MAEQLRPKRGSDTRDALIQAGIAGFGRHGFAAAAVEDLCAEAGVTTGALYHHFGGKPGLFAAVVEALDARLVELSMAAALAAVRTPEGDLWAGFQAGLAAFVAAAADPALRRILGEDAPAVLGMAAFDAIRDRHGRGYLRQVLKQLAAADVIAAEPIELTAALVLGLLYAAAGAVAAGAPPAAAMAELMRFLAVMRRP